MIGYVHPGWVHEEFKKSLAMFCEYDKANRSIYAGEVRGQGLYVADNRNVVARRFLEHKDQDVLLFIDTDVVFAPESVYAILDTVNADHPIVCGMYVTRFGEGGILGPVWMEEVGDNPLAPVANFQIGGMRKLTACGMGFTAIHRNVLERLLELMPDDPWCWFGHDLCKIKGVNSRLGEDTTFCLRAINAGFTVWGHGGVLLGHKKQEILTIRNLVLNR